MHYTKIKILSTKLENLNQMTNEYVTVPERANKNFKINLKHLFERNYLIITLVLA